MKRSIIIIFSITLILFWGTYKQSYLLKGVSQEAVSVLKDISGAIDAPQSAKEIFSKYEDNWKKVKELLSLIISHDEIDQIEIHNKRLYFFLKKDMRADSLAEIGELKSIYTELYEKFKISFKNIL